MAAGTTTTRKQAKGTTKRVTVKTLSPEQQAVKDFREAKDHQSKGRKGEKDALAIVKGIIIAKPLTDAEVKAGGRRVTDPADSAPYFIGVEDKQTDPRATAWDAYLASLPEAKRTAAVAQFYAPNVTDKTNEPYIRKV